MVIDVENWKTVEDVENGANSNTGKHMLKHSKLLRMRNTDVMFFRCLRAFAFLGTEGG